MAVSINLTNPIFHNDDAARAHLESIRWPDGPWCPHCGNSDQTTIHRLQGESHRAGLFQCNACREHFTVTVGGVMERSHIPLSKWVLAFHLMAASKKGISAHQLMRTLGLGSYRTAWFMAHRIREAMKIDGKSEGPLGGEGKIVEADETVVGGKERFKRKSKRNPDNIGAVGKQVVFSLVERGGKARSHHVPNVNAKTLRPILVKHVSRKSALMTDDAGQYRIIGPEFARYDTVEWKGGQR